MSESYIPHTSVDMYTESIQTIMSKLVSDVDSMASSVSSRVEYFIKEYKSEFKRHIFYPFLGDFAESEALRVMKGPLILYALGLNGQVLIDLTGILERYITFYIREIFSSLISIQKFPEGKAIIEAMLEKRYAYELSEYLVALGIWNDSDKKKIRKLYKKRNLAAHKNEKKVEAILQSDRTKLHRTKSTIHVGVLEMDLAMSNFDVIPYIFDTIRLLRKLLQRSVLKTERARIAQAILESKIENEEQFFFKPIGK